MHLIGNIASGGFSIGITFSSVSHKVSNRATETILMFQHLSDRCTHQVYSVVVQKGLIRDSTKLTPERQGQGHRQLASDSAATSVSSMMVPERYSHRDVTTMWTSCLTLARSVCGREMIGQSWTTRTQNSLPEKTHHPSPVLTKRLTAHSTSVKQASAHLTN